MIKNSPMYDLILAYMWYKKNGMEGYSDLCLKNIRIMLDNIDSKNAA